MKFNLKKYKRNLATRRHTYSLSFGHAQYGIVHLETGLISFRCVQSNQQCSYRNILRCKKIYIFCLQQKPMTLFPVVIKLLSL